MHLRILPEPITNKPVEDNSSTQIKQTVNQIQAMIDQLQQQKQENQADGTSDEQVCKA